MQHLIQLENLSIKFPLNIFKTRYFGFLMPDYILEPVYFFNIDNLLVDDLCILVVSC